MKLVYTILFFADTLALLVLTYLFMKLADGHTSQFLSLLLLAGIVASIALLIHLILRYMQLPASPAKNEWRKLEPTDNP